MLRYVNNFRGFAILIIVIGHTLESLTWKNNFSLQTFTTVISQNGSVYFVFIAGFLFQHLSKKYKYKDYLLKKFKNVVLPYILVSIPAIFLCISRNLFGSNVPSWFRIEFLHLSFLQKIFVLYLTGHHLFTFWFIPMIAIFYVLSPLFIWINENPIFYTVIPLLLMITLQVNRTPDDEVIHAFLHFISVYIIGMFCSCYREKVFLYVKKFWIILAVICIALLVLESSFRILSGSSEMMSINTLSKVILCILFTYFLYHFDARMPDFVHCQLKHLAELSFGIYFLHGYFDMLYLDGVAKSFGANSVLREANFFTFCFLLAFQLGGSIILIRLVQKRFGSKSRLLVGC